MNDHIVCPVRTSPGEFHEFGEFTPPEFQAEIEPSVVKSVALPFDFVRPLMSGKPLRNRWRALRRCTVYLHPEDEGGFSVVAADLPGVISEGDSEEEAIANIKEAFQGVIQSYKDRGKKIPWLEKLEEPEPGSISRTVLVHA